MSRPVLFVGLSPESFAPLQTILTGEPYELLHAPHVAEAWQLLERAQVVVACESLTGGGVAFLASVRATHPSVVRVLVLDQLSPTTHFDAVNRAEVYRLVAAPLDATQLSATLRQAVAEARRNEAREAVWAAARQQQAALGRLRAGDWETVGLPARVSHDDPASSRPRPLELWDVQGQRLSSREREIVEALGSGRRVKDIARDLIISTHTVRNHLKAIYRKLNVRSQFELIGLMARNH